MSFRNNYRLIAVFVLSIFSQPLLSDITLNQIGNWNYKKVYLSPARHSDTGNRGECKTYYNPQNSNSIDYIPDENIQAAFFASFAASTDYIGAHKNPNNANRNLRARGYKVRIGNGSVTSAVNNSNSWGADVHIPIHSNARPSASCWNWDNPDNKHGLVVIYKSNNGKNLADRIKRRSAGNTPGTNDFICHNSSNCTSFNCLAELCNTRAVAAYLEREFHTWNKGMLYLSRPESRKVSWKLGWAVDDYLNYP